MPPTSPEHLPNFDAFVENIAALALPISASELHGMLCGYLCAGAFQKSEHYLRALIAKDSNNHSTRNAASALFEIYTLSKHQITTLDFDFKLLLPDDSEPLADRAQAFSEWCEGFSQALTMAGISYEHLEDEESQEALQHIKEFAQLDYHNLDIDEDDEKALMEVSEYTRMAVLRLSNDLREYGDERGSSDTAH
jgi:yecA family protein